MLIFDDALIGNGDFTVSADLSIPSGVRVGIIGPSGAGKTTLLHAVAGFLPLVRGGLTWHGKRLDLTPPADRPVSIVFQEGNLFPHMTVEQNVALGISPRLRLGPQDREGVASALHRVGLDGLATRKPRELSGGQRSRVALARVLVRGRPILLLDEPFAALGPNLRVEMLELVAALAEESGATMLMVTHDPADALRVAAETILVFDGKARAPSPTSELFEAPPPELARYLGKG